MIFNKFSNITKLILFLDLVLTPFNMENTLYTIALLDGKHNNFRTNSKSSLKI